MRSQAPLQEFNRRMANLCNLTSERAFTGTGDIPFVVDIRDTLGLAAIALNDVAEVHTDILRAWHNSWENAGGTVERIYADQRNNEFRTDLLITGPAANAHEDTLVYPAVAFAHSLELTTPRIFARSRALTDIRLGLGFVGADDQPFPQRWSEFALLGIELEPRRLIERPFLGSSRNSSKLAAVTLLAERAALIVNAADDPLKVTIQQIQAGAKRYEDVMADPEAGFKWRRSSRSREGMKNVVEVCLIGVNPALFSGNREIVLVRDSDRPGSVRAFTDTEWDAFVGGAKDGEFDLD